MKLLILSDLDLALDDWTKFLDMNKDNFETVLLLGGIDIFSLKLITQVFSEKLILAINGDNDKEGNLNDCGIPNINGLSVNLNNTTISGIEGCLSRKEGSFIHSEREIFKIISNLSSETDVIISHNSPLGIHDNNHLGYFGLKEFIECCSPKYCLHGHQYINKVTTYKNTKIIGVHGGIILNTETDEIIKVL